MPTAAEKAESDKAVKVALDAQAAKFNEAYAAKEAELAAEKEAREAAERRATQATEAAEAAAGELAVNPDAAGPSGTKDYRLVADLYTPTTSKPGQPFQFATYHKGDTVPLDVEQAERLLASGDVEELDGTTSKPERGGQTTAPGES